MNKNYYLSLLETKAKELKKELEKANEENHSAEYKKYLICGYIVMMNSILELGIGDLHSYHFDNLTTLIYYTRQRAIHYGYFNGFGNLEDTANDIINGIEENINYEQLNYDRLFDESNFSMQENVLIKYTSDIKNDNYMYKFISKDKKQVLYIPSQRIFTLVKKSKEKIESLIVNTNVAGTLYYYTDGESKETLDNVTTISNDEIKYFFKENYDVIDENYNAHNIIMYNIINSFVTDPLNSVQIMEYSSNEQYCKNTIDVIRDFIVDRTMYENYIYNNHLIRDKYSPSKIAKTDYSKLFSKINKTVANKLTESDLFFIDVTLNETRKYYFSLKNECDIEDLDPKVFSTIFIQIFEIGPKYFSLEFITSSPELKKCHDNLLKYRNIFSHYVLSNKAYNDCFKNFKSEFLNFVKLLEYIDRNQKLKSATPNTQYFSTIERSKEDFFNYKHEQYLKIRNSIYIGKKILYSKHNPNSKSIIAVIPGKKDSSMIQYYEKDLNGFISPKYLSETTKNAKKVQQNASVVPLKSAKEVSFDSNLSYLFTAYKELIRGRATIDDLKIVFNSCDENSNFTHKDDLSAVILRYYVQGYIPAELMQYVKLDLSKLNRHYISLLNKKGEVIATIINERKCKLASLDKDKKGYFSRIADIEHDFSKRRHTR